MAGFAIREFTSQQTDGYFDAANDYGVIQETPAPGVATVIISEVGNVTSFSFSLQASHDGVLYQDIEDFDAVTVEGAYQIGGPWPYIKVLLDSITLGGGTRLQVSLCWIYD